MCEVKIKLIYCSERAEFDSLFGASDGSSDVSDDDELK
jgi:hypothetical protein